MSIAGMWCTCADYNGMFEGPEHSTKEEAIAEMMKDLENGGYRDVCLRGHFEVGQVVEITVEQLIDVDDFIENAQCRAEELAGDSAEDYLNDVTKEQLIELEGIVADWFRRNFLNPHFYGIENSEKVLVPSHLQIRAREQQKEESCL